MRFLFHELLYRPLLNGLIWLYETIAFQDIGIAIVLLTLVIRFILYPLFYKSFKQQALLQKLQPKIKEIQASHKDNREKQAQALMELYKEHKVNPFSSFGLLLIQLPILIALYRVFLTPLTPEIFVDLYSFVSMPSEIGNMFLGLIDLSERNILIVGLAAAVQYVQGRMSVPKRTSSKEKESTAERLGRQMVLIGPVITVVILMTLPAAVGVYWLTTALFSVGQQAIIKRSLKEKDDHGDISRTSEETSGTERPQ